MVFSVILFFKKLMVFVLSAINSSYHMVDPWICEPSSIGEAWHESLCHMLYSLPTRKTGLIKTQMIEEFAILRN